MSNWKLRLDKALKFIPSLNQEYLKDKWQRIRNLKFSDMIHLIKTSRTAFVYGISSIIMILIIIPILTYIYFGRDLTSKERIINKKNAGIVLLDRNEKPFFTLFNATTKEPVSIIDLHDYTKQSFIAVEDKDFYHHPGFSLSGIGRAIRVNILNESFAQGGSTISQQLIKNAILSPDKQLLRKYQELVLALELERKYTKDEILEMYLNTIYFGEGSFGIQDASQKYFSKDAKDLTLAESALLAGIIRAPSAYSPISGDYNKALKRKNLILDLMQEQGYITPQEKLTAQKEEIKLSPTEDDINEEGVHFALMVKDMLIKEYGEQRVANSGFIVKTTLDLALQKVAQQAVADQVARLQASSVSNGAAVVIDPKTGEILALVGSHDWSDGDNGKINMAIRPRQPGSSFKPIIYAKAIDEHVITAATKLKDEPVDFGGYQPKNYDNRFRGEVLARYALANSLNIPAVHVMDMIGVPAGVTAARDMGITTLKDSSDYGLPLVLGAAEVPLLEMTNAYAVFANEGNWTQYTTFLEVRDKNNNIILENKPNTRRVLPASVAFIISDILSDNKTRSDTFGSALNMSRKAAVKTGTTNDYKDALTIGYTPQVVVGVWIGNNNNTPMDSVAGSLGAAPIWRQIMEAYLVDKPVVDFRKPTSVIDLKVCVEEGLKVEFATSSAYTEYFTPGTEPTKLCNLPSPTPTEDPEKKKQEEEKKHQEEEEKRKKEEEDKKKENPTETPIPTNTITPTQGPTNSPINPTIILPAL